LDQKYSFNEALYLTREDKGEVYYYAMRLNDVKEERSGYLNDKLFIVKIVIRVIIIGLFTWRKIPMIMNLIRLFVIILGLRNGRLI
jgi:hypothetical protein